MAIQTFTSGQVLTAAQQNALQANDYNQTVSTKTANYTLVAADKGTRIVMNVASANTITVNTSLFSAGDTLVLQNIGAGVSTVTAGTATVSSAGPLAIPQYGSGTLYFTSASAAIFFPSAVSAASSGLTLITSAAFSSQSSVQVNNAFSSTYANYLIQLNYNSADDNVIQFLQLGTSGTPYAGSDYSFVMGALSFYAGTASYNNTGSTGTTKWTYGGKVGSGGNNATIHIFSPFLSEKASFNSLTGGRNNNPETTSSMAGGGINTTTAYTDFTLTPNGGTLTGKYYVYGYANS